MKFSASARNVRYPAKMVGRMVDAIFDKEKLPFDSVLDPFCGSGEVLIGAQARGIGSVGVDINPYAALLSSVRLEDWSVESASAILTDCLERCRSDASALPMGWERKSYWFSPATLCKLERLRYVASRMRLHASPEGRSVLLALAQSVRLASRADNRSPKPFISRDAVLQKRGKHRDPLLIAKALHDSLVMTRRATPARVMALVHCGDSVRETPREVARRRFSHVVTSPPYLNAQDYFRNSKLELFFLEGLLPFEAKAISSLFVGTERQLLMDPAAEVGDEMFGYLRKLDGSFAALARSDAKSAVVAYRYFSDMHAALLRATSLLRSGGALWLVTGDNLVAGVRVPTTAIVARMVIDIGLRRTGAFVDKIRNRTLAPRRRGHIGLIKEEQAVRFEKG